MGLKPIPLAAYSKDFQPPVTGVGGRPDPVANMYDASGLFPARPRIGSTSKKRRLDEIDQVFNLSMQYPPLTYPTRQPLSVSEVKTFLVAATAAGGVAKPLIDDPDTDPKVKALGNLSIALLDLVTAIVENGIAPEAGAGTKSKVSPPPRNQRRDLKNLGNVSKNRIPNPFSSMPILVTFLSVIATACATPFLPVFGPQPSQMRKLGTLIRRKRYAS
jgi:hypothetical protein